MIRTVNCDSDTAQIAEIYNHYIAETTVSFEIEPVTVQQMRQRITSISKDCPYFVYEHEGNIAGYCYVHPWKERAAYSGTMETTIYLSKDYCNMGIGKQLMEHLIEECRQRNYRVLIACVTAENVHSIEFHKSLGFEQVSHFKNVGKKFDRLLDVIDFEYSLSDIKP